MNCGTPGFPVLLCLLESAQTHVHWVGQCLQLSNLMRFPLMRVSLFACVSSHLLLFSLPGMSDSLQPHRLQHARPLCPLPFPEVCPSSFPLHQWCHPAISFSDALFTFCPWSFSAWGTFQWVICSHQMTRIWVSVSVPVLPTSIQISLKMDWFDRLAVQLTFRSLLQHHSSKASVPWRFTFFKVQLSQPCVTTGKTIALIIWIFVSRVMSLLFNTLSYIAFLPRSKRLLISWLQLPSAVTLEPKKRKSVTTSTPLFSLR